MRYLSLFSGIGGFEVAIHQVFGQKATCVGYSEIDKDAIKEYERHYPDHQNLGDINLLKKKDIDKLGKIDLVVGGFPCNDLSSARHDERKGLEGDKSGLFWKMLNVLKWVRNNNPYVHIIIENNACMAHKWRDMITSELQKLFKKKVMCNYFDSSQWIIQRRRRFYWTLKEIDQYKGERVQTMDDVLLPIDQAVKYKLSDKAIRYLNESPRHLTGSQGEIIVKKNNKCYEIQKTPYPTRVPVRSSSSIHDYIRCVDTSLQYLLDYRLCKTKKYFIPRYVSKYELNNLFGFPQNYVQTDLTVYRRLYGMSVVPIVIVHILSHLDL